jgi:hypothetical protein
MPFADPPVKCHDGDGQVTIRIDLTCLEDPFDDIAAFPPILALYEPNYLVGGLSLIHFSAA